MQLFLHVVASVDSFQEHDVDFTLSTACGVPIGYITGQVARRLLESPFFIVRSPQIVSVAADLDTLDKRTAAFAQVAEKWRQDDKQLADGWRNELYTVFCPSKEPYVLVERAFSVMLGVVTYGVHINGYVAGKDGQELQMWIPRRSATKQTYPGLLDNMVAGGIAFPHGIWDNVVKECHEEAGLAAAFVHQRAKAAGLVSYMTQPGGSGGHVQPEVEYIYDIEFRAPHDPTPRPVDGEAAGFELMPMLEVVRRVHAGEFKPNCALVVVDFMVRHGLLTAENEPNLHAICRHLHRAMPFPTRN